ncbi:hypothetical protein N0V83_005256 [Neocucurbitaria cava]|uniref:Uncharacterized protein n=1 Tax=Neocucurbitaria cava TaxID=798079 RepID=A0A9W8Y8U8_9PLEO|nr:hypothetical protein N0V83_005256 [Neocucurbitaria cava]
MGQGQSGNTEEPPEEPPEGPPEPPRGDVGFNEFVKKVEQNFAENGGDPRDIIKFRELAHRINMAVDMQEGPTKPRAGPMEPYTMDRMEADNFRMIVEKQKERDARIEQLQKKNPWHLLQMDDNMFCFVMPYGPGGKPGPKPANEAEENKEGLAADVFNLASSKMAEALDDCNNTWVYKRRKPCYPECMQPELGFDHCHCEEIRYWKGIHERDGAEYVSLVVRGGSERDSDRDGLCCSSDHDGVEPMAGEEEPNSE